MLLNCSLLLAFFLPPDIPQQDLLVLSAMAITESNCNINTIDSPKGAKGILQITIDTGKYLWYSCGYKDKHFLPALLKVPEININLAYCYYKLLMKKHHSLIKVLTCYNGGYRQLFRLNKGRTICHETANYIVKILYLLEGKRNDNY